MKNRLKTVYRNEVIVAEFIYDVDGKRVQSETQEEGKVSYIFNFGGKVLYEEHGVEKKTSYIYAHANQIAGVEGIVGGDGEIIYYHHDNLGSTRVITDSQGKIFWEQDYMPFGDDLHKPRTVDVGYDINAEYKFTGQREVKGIGLYYYGARHYDPEIGRFITEDSYLGELVNPQSQNLYIYVLQNPLKYTDPTGHNAIVKSFESFKEIGVGFWSGFKYRADKALDSPYDFANYLSIGLLDGTWSGAKERAATSTDSVYDFTNYITFGVAGTFKGTIAPEEPFSPEHWLNSLEAAGLIIAGMQLLNQPTTVSMLDDIDNSVGKQVMNKADDTFVDDFVEEMSKNSDDLLWNTLESYNKVTKVIDGKERIYAQIGDRLYTPHAVERMMPYGKTTYGRSVSPNFVEDVLTNGQLVKTYKVNGVTRECGKVELFKL